MSDTIHIIGAGLIGLSTADSLTQRGARVVVWDRGRAPGMGAGFANGSILHPSQGAPWGVDRVSVDPAEREKIARENLELARGSRTRLARRTKELGLSTARRNVVQIFDAKAARDAKLAEYARLGVEARAGRSLGHPAVSLPDDESADARAYALALAVDLAARGVAFRLGERVGLERGPDGLVVLRAGERMRAARVVVAAGVGTSEILRGAGVELDVFSVPGHALGFARPRGMEAVSIMHADSRTALTVLEREVRLSGSVGLDGPDDLLPIWREISPGLVEELGEPKTRWTGLRPCTRDGRAVMRRVASGLWVNAGHAHMGWTLCAGAGERVAESVVGSGRKQGSAIPPTPATPAPRR